MASLQPSPESLEAAQLLLDHGASPFEPRRPGGKTPLDSAAYSGNSELMRIFLARGTPSKPQADDAISWTQVEEANLPIIVMLLETGADVNKLGSKGTFNAVRPAEIAAGRAIRQGERELMRVLLRHHIDLSASPSALTSTFSIPVVIQLIADPPLLELALQSGGNPNQLGFEGNTPLLFATQVRKGLNGYERPDPALRLRVVDILLRAGADPTIANKAGITPIMQTLPDEDELAAHLVEHGATVHLDPKIMESTASRNVSFGEVSWAALSGKDALGAALVAKNRGVSQGDCGAIYYASLAGATRTLKALLDFNAPRKFDLLEDPGAHLGASPLHIAAYNGHLEAVKILLDRNVSKVDETSPKYVGFAGGGHGPSLPIPVIRGGDTALILAAQGGHLDVGRELIRRGADPAHKGDLGRTAMHWIENSRDAEQWAVLLGGGAR
jgi:ankyrin repeat protein